MEIHQGLRLPVESGHVFTGYGLRLATACVLLALTGCAGENPQLAAVAAPRVQGAPPPTVAELGAPDATFTLLPSQPDRATGVGTVSYQGRRVHFSAAAITTSRIGTQSGPFTGMVYNLASLRDFNGSFIVTPVSNGKELVMQNKQGVTIHVAAGIGVEKDVKEVMIKLAPLG